MRTIIEKILNDYTTAKQEPFAGHRMGIFFRNDIPNIIYKTGIVDPQTHMIAGSVGQGNWATVPWVCIFDRNITQSATKGVYIVYLLAKDGNTLYLTFNQGCTEIRNKNSKSDTIKIMRQKAAEIVTKIDSRGFSTDERIDLGSGLTGLGELYQKGTIFYKAYKKGNIPSNDELLNDLNNMMAIYSDYTEKFQKANDTEEWWPSKEEYDPGITKEVWLKLLYSKKFTNKALAMLAKMHTLGGAASCAMLSKTYGNSTSHYVMTAVHAAEAVLDATHCPILPRDEDSARLWTILFVGRDTNKGEDGGWVWKLRDELHEALIEFGIERYLPKTGIFDSWEIVNNTTAIKTCDKSFFEYNSSGVPKEICWFFDAEDLSTGDNKQLKLIYNGAIFSGRITNESSDRRRVRIFWNIDMGKKLLAYKHSNVKAQFNKVSDNTYEIILLGGEKAMTTKEQVAAIKKFIEAKGFNYDGSLIENFYLSLKSKPFVILAGTSGTGKTRLVRLFAEAIQAEYKLVSVRPDWSDSSDLFGHVDLNQKFVPGAIIDFVKQAELNPTKPYFLCLDEMNLARVEYYMSDILSAIETRRYESGMIITDPVVSSANYGTDATSAGKYGKVILPGNLYIVGTVNMDETTFPFSKKVLDRANTIEFSYVDLLSMPSFSTATADKITVTNEFLASKYITLNDCDAVDKEYIAGVCTTLSRINGILEIANAHIGYRVRDEIVFYMLNNRETDLLDNKVAFDNQIMQKILPRIQGSSESIKKMLEELLKICDSEKYEASSKKINFMIKRYEEDGFTSYWL